MVLEADLGRRQPERCGDVFLRAGRAEARGQLRAIELREAAVLRELYPAAHRPHPFLEHDNGILAGLAAEPLERQADGGADSGMPGEGKLGGRREDARLCRVGGVLRRPHEHRLRQVELARNPLHGAGVQALGIEHHGERVAGERPVGENVENLVAALHARCLPVRLFQAGSPSGWLTKIRTPRTAT